MTTKQRTFQSPEWLNWTERFVYPFEGDLKRLQLRERLQLSVLLHHEQLMGAGAPVSVGALHHDSFMRAYPELCPVMVNRAYQLRLSMSGPLMVAMLSFITYSAPELVTFLHGVKRLTLDYDIPVATLALLHTHWGHDMIPDEPMLRGMWIDQKVDPARNLGLNDLVDLVRAGG